MEQAANIKQANFSMSARERAVHKTTVKEYAYNISAAVANAILVTLGMGLLMQTIAGFVHFQPLYMAGTLAQDLLAPALGIAVAVELRTTTLVMFSSMIAATVGSNAVHFVTATKGVAAVTATGQTAVQAAGTGVFSTGQPVSAVCAALIAALLGKYLSGKTPLDMVLVPFAATMVGTLAGLGLAAVVTPALIAVSGFIAKSMAVNPVLGSVCISVVWALFLMTPASSAALAVALMLDPVSSAAAAIGTTAQFVGFTAMSWKQNTVGANIAQFVVTPKLQFPNLIVNPLQLIPPVVAAAVCAPLATVLFNFRATYTVGGLGLNSFIAPIYFWGQSTGSFVTYVVCGMALPALISVVGFQIMKKMKLVRDGEMHLTVL